MFRTLSGLAAAAALVVTVACGQTDAGITTEVKSKLAADETVKAYQVDVDTDNGVVTLTGTVESPDAKATAVQIARNTEGVRDVIDQIEIGDRTAATSGIADDDIDVDAPDVDVDVDNETERDLDRAGDRTAEGAKKVGSATVEGAKKVGEATADGAKKVGSAIRDAVTDDDRDSDNDGR